MALVRVHTCKSREYVAQGIDDPPADKCRCRKLISKEKAKQKVDEGEARFVVLSRTHEPAEVPCPLCKADAEFKNCANCHGTGRVEIDNVRQEYGDDIVLVSRSAVDKKEKKYRPALAMKTPRVATIESEHVQMAYSGSVDTRMVNGRKTRVWSYLEPRAQAAQDRIEEYGRLILDARMFVGKDRVPIIKAEPNDNPKTGQGREFDYGRAI